MQWSCVYGGIAQLTLIVTSSAAWIASSSACVLMQEMAPLSWQRCLPFTLAMTEYYLQTAGVHMCEGHAGIVCGLWTLAQGPCGLKRGSVPQASLEPCVHRSECQKDY